MAISFPHHIPHSYTPTSPSDFAIAHLCSLLLTLMKRIFSSVVGGELAGEARLCSRCRHSHKGKAGLWEVNRGFSSNLQLRTGKDLILFHGLKIIFEALFWLLKLRLKWIVVSWRLIFNEFVNFRVGAGTF